MSLRHFRRTPSKPNAGAITSTHACRFWLDDFEPFVASGLAGPWQQPGRWRLEKGYWGARKKAMLFGAGGNDCPVLQFSPNLKGRYAIYVGGYSIVDPKMGIHIRLSGEPHFTYIQMKRKGPAFEALYFKTAELDGRSIEIGCFRCDCAFDYIKLVPVKEAKLPARKGKVIGICDFPVDANISAPPLFEAGSAVRRHADIGYDMIMWKSYAVRCEYHTKIGEARAPIDKAAAKLPEWYKTIGDLLQQYDTMRQAVDEAKKVGIPIYGWARINNEFSKLNHQFSPTTPFHVAHPTQRMKHRDGTLTTKLSFAYPEIRKYKIDILCEVAAYGMDGMFIDVLRHPPMALFDQPIVDAYIQKTGQDPRQMENDGTEDWLRFRAEVFTQFLREARAAIDKQAGRHLPFMIRTMDQPWHNLVAGCDVDRWIDEGIVDGIVFGPWGAQAHDYPDRIDLRPYIERAKGKIKIYGQVWRYGSALHAELMAADLYDQGVDGVALYESSQTVALPTLRERLWRLGCPDALPAARS